MNELRRLARRPRSARAQPRLPGGRRCCVVALVYLARGAAVTRRAATRRAARVEQKTADLGVDARRWPRR
ncbi:MAG: hypothetical protein MZV65_53735 [Chromatiales bacterium]|nr:hypothetical protein [Chromatiales bacterium]